MSEWELHSGPVSEVTDVTGRSNIAGAGINMAQRVMDCGDAGHILLSQHVADDLVQYRQWAPRLRDLGECEVKHGVRIRLVNLYAEPLGNPEPPEKFRPVAATAPVSSPVVKPKRTSWLAAGAILIAILVVGFLIFRTVWHRSTNRALARRKPQRDDSTCSRQIDRSAAIREPERGQIQRLLR